MGEAPPPPLTVQKWSQPVWDNSHHSLVMSSGVSWSSGGAVTSSSLTYIICQSRHFSFFSKQQIKIKARRIINTWAYIRVASSTKKSHKPSLHLYFLVWPWQHWGGGVYDLCRSQPPGADQHDLTSHPESCHVVRLYVQSMNSTHLQKNISPWSLGSLNLHNFI